MTQFIQLLSKAESVQSIQATKELIVKLILSAIHEDQTQKPKSNHTRGSIGNKDDWLRRLGELDSLLERQVRHAITQHQDALSLMSIDQDGLGGEST